MLANNKYGRRAVLPGLRIEVQSQVVGPAAIIGVAIMSNDLLYQLLAPNRHHNLIHQLSLTHASETKPVIEGFVDADNNFLTRTQAYVRAGQTGQLKRLAGPEFYQGPELFSEDIW